LFVLLSVLISSCSCRYIHAHINGTLSCSHPFSYRLLLVDLDNFKDDVVILYPSRTSVNNTAKYTISGNGWEPAAETDIEPVLVIEHSCGAIYKCVCKEFAPSPRLVTTFNADLSGKDLTWCQACRRAWHSQNNELYPPIRHPWTVPAHE
ncbi:hypothetical protein PMAYCL1PPCAC_24730, partial [Pristionchus mayeri]